MLPLIGSLLLLTCCRWAPLGLAFLGTRDALQGWLRRCRVFPEPLRQGRASCAR